jgi:hypothetical protein
MDLHGNAVPKGWARSKSPEKNYYSPNRASDKSNPPPIDAHSQRASIAPASAQ